MTDGLYSYTHDHRIIQEFPVEGKRLGRHVYHDSRSRDYPADEASKIVSVAHMATGLPLDQGDLGSCTANALVGALNSAPDFKSGANALTEKDAVSIYGLETELEGEPYPPNDPGGTGLMVCKAGKQMGLVRSYRHAFGLDHALKALVLKPVIFGVDWYEGFDRPDSSGLVKIEGQVRGGHEIVALGIDTTRSLVWFVNSWGDWGVAANPIGVPTGAFCMSSDTVDQLLQSQGDCTVPVV